MDGRTLARAVPVGGDGGRDIRRHRQVEPDGSASRVAVPEGWLELHLYGDRILPFDVSTARLSGELMDRARAVGRAPGFADVAIAATAASRGLAILTCDLRHFVPLGVRAIDPFDTLPG